MCSCLVWQELLFPTLYAFPFFQTSLFGARYISIQNKYISQHSLQVDVTKGPSSGQWKVCGSLLELSLKASQHALFLLYPLKLPASPVAEMMAKALATILDHEVKGHTLGPHTVSWEEPEFSVPEDCMEQSCYTTLDCHFQTSFFLSPCSVASS